MLTALALHSAYVCVIVGESMRKNTREEKEAHVNQRAISLSLSDSFIWIATSSSEHQSTQLELEKYCYDLALLPPEPCYGFLGL